MLKKWIEGEGSQVKLFVLALAYLLASSSIIQMTPQIPLPKNAYLVFDFILIIFLIVAFKQRLSFKLSPSYVLIGCLSLALAFGGLCGFLLKLVEIPHPFHSVTNLPLYFFLIAPLFEEFLFRIGFYGLIIDRKDIRLYGIYLTSALFSLCHLFPGILFDHKDYQTFYHFQAFYTFGLGCLACLSMGGKRRVFAPILVHLLFNLGFYVLGIQN